MYHVQDKLVMVKPRDGKPYLTWLLSFQMSDLGMVYYVSGPQAIFPGEAEITEQDGKPLVLSGEKLNGQKWGK